MHRGIKHCSTGMLASASCTTSLPMHRDFAMLHNRESPTDVVVQHLSTGGRVRVRCRDQVLQLALHSRLSA